ncbi:MAG: type IV pilus biogenesis protein PilP, partial [Burkholderiaceae bacterium]
MQNYLKPIVLFSGLVLSSAVFAESASDNLTRIEAETLVLKAREKQLDVQAKIIARQSEIASKQAESDRLTQTAVYGNPVILSIEGLGKAMFATLQMENGNAIDVQTG